MSQTRQPEPEPQAAPLPFEPPVDLAPAPAIQRARSTHWLAILTSPLTLVLGITVLGAALRLYRLDARSLWFDELVSAQPVRLSSLEELVAYIAIWLESTPLAFVVTWLLRGLGGGEAAIRLPFLVAGVLNIPALYLLGKTLARPRVGLGAALLLAVAPFAVYYSQEARPYTFLMLFTTLQMLFAYRAIVHGRVGNWLGVALATILNLYAGYLALAPTAAAAIFLAAILLGEGGRLVRRAPGHWTRRQFARRLGGAGGTAGLVYVAYLPWLPRFQAFIEQPGAALNRFPPGTHATWADLRAVLGGLGLTNLWLALGGLGLLTAMLWLGHRQWRSGLLLLLWLGAPLGGFWLATGDAFLRMEVRYFAFFFPLTMLLVALGAESCGRALAGGLARLARRRRLGAAPAPAGPPAGRLQTVAYAAVLAVLLGRAAPTLAQSYGSNKERISDYRGAAAHVMAVSPPGSVALVLGMWDLVSLPLVPDGLGYYGWLYRAPITVMDGSRLDGQTAQRLEQAQGRLWGVVYHPWPLPPDEAQRARAAGLTVVSFDAVTLLEPPPGPPRAQITALLRWGTPRQAGLLATRSLFDEEFQRAGLGDNLLPPAGGMLTGAQEVNDENSEQILEQWALGPGATRTPDGQAFVLRPGAGSEAGVTLASRRIPPGFVYVLRYRCHTAGLQGTARVAVAVYDTGPQSSSAPDVSEYPCAPHMNKNDMAFAFVVPDGTAQVVIRLRATGQGSAVFDAMEVRPVR